tara:strand:+ start:163 stop:492 length:330 start_codon:yes stop_codon:yes gene_type:complete
MAIYPKCNQPNNNMNICLRHDGYVVPCCFLADIGQPWNELKKLLGDKLSQIHIKNNNIDNINKSEAYRMIYESFTNNPMKICIKQCSNEKELALDTMASGHPYTEIDVP